MMSELIEAKEGQVYTGYTLAAHPFCRQSGNIGICYEAEMKPVGVVLTITIKIPITATKQFIITGDGTFEWKFGPVVIKNTISYFSKKGKDYSFYGDFSIDTAVGNIKIGSHDFVNDPFLNAPTQLSDAEFTNMLILQLLLDEETKSL